jgi:hypothetical protein
MNGTDPTKFKQDSPRSACAASALKLSSVETSKYAQAGIDVPAGIGSGNL